MTGTEGKLLATVTITGKKGMPKNNAVSVKTVML